MPVAQAPTTLNSMTHYALTESQEGIMEGDDVGDALRQALRETGAEEVKSRLQAAIDAGLIGVTLPALPEAGQELPPGGEGGEDANTMWVICDGGDPPKYWQDASQEWVDDEGSASHYNSDGKDAETLPTDPPTAEWVPASQQQEQRNY